MQLNVGRAFTVDYALREVLFEQTEKLDAIRTMVQVVLATQQYSSNFFLQYLNTLRRCNVLLLMPRCDCSGIILLERRREASTPSRKM
jgi:hypothetical protein